jgi:hypothetical protein
MNNDRRSRRRQGFLQYLLLAGILAAALMLAACTAGSQDSLLLDSVPADAVMLGSVQPERALGNSDVRDSLDRLVGVFGDKTLEDALAQVQEASGIDPAAVEQVLVFGTADEQGAVLIAGPYSEAKLKETAEEKGGDLSVTTHRGYDLHTTGDGATLVFLAEELLLMGKLEAAKAVIDVRAGEADALGGELRDSFEALGDPPAKLFLLTSEGLFDKPEEAREEESGDFALDDLPIDLSFLTEIDSVGATLDAVQQDFALALTMTYPDADQAGNAQQAIETLLGLVTLLGVAPELSDLLGGLEVTAEGAVLTVAGQFSADDLEGLAEALSELDIVE